MHFLAFVGAITLLALITYFFVTLEDRHNDEEKESLDIIYHSAALKEEFKRFRMQHPHWTERKAAWRFFVKTGRLEQARIEKERYANSLKAEEKKREKEYIIKRAYARKYEDFIFSLFSPFAKSVYGGEKWELQLFCHLPVDYIKYRMKKAGFENVDDLYNEFINNDLLHLFIRHEGSSNATVEGCYIGDTLGRYANVISEDDYNIDSWIKKHGQSMSKVDLEFDLNTYMLPF